MQEPMNELDHAAIGEKFVNEMSYESSDELYHYGVKGMKWGVQKHLKNARRLRDAKKLSEAAMDFVGKKSVLDRTIRDFESLKRDNYDDKELIRLMEREEIPILSEHAYQSFKKLQSLGKQYTKRHGDRSLESLMSDTEAINAGLNKYMEYSRKVDKLELDIIDMVDDDLYHHGIKGQKWGVRRFQKKDGTRTPAGRKRYGDKAKEGLKKAGDAAKEGLRKAGVKIKEQYSKHKSEKAAEKLRNKPISELTDEELKLRIERAQKEKQLFDLERPVSSLTKQQENLGKKFLVNAGQKVIGPALVDAGKDLMTRFLKDRIGDALGLNGKDVDDALKGLKQEVAELGLKKQKKELTEYLNGNKTSDDMDELAKEAKRWGYEKTIAEGKTAKDKYEKRGANDGTSKPNTSNNTNNSNASNTSNDSNSQNTYDGPRDSDGRRPALGGSSKTFKNAGQTLLRTPTTGGSREKLSSVLIPTTTKRIGGDTLIPTRTRKTLERSTPTSNSNSRSIHDIYVNDPDMKAKRLEEWLKKNGYQK